MNAKTINISDATNKVYQIGFPVHPSDLAVFWNGIKLSEGQYTFSQATNNVTIHGDLQVGDILQLRIMKDA